MQADLFRCLPKRRRDTAALESPGAVRLIHTFAFVGGAALVTGLAGKTIANADARSGLM